MSFVSLGATAAMLQRVKGNVNRLPHVNLSHFTHLCLTTQLISALLQGFLMHSEHCMEGCVDTVEVQLYPNVILSSGMPFRN